MAEWFYKKNDEKIGPIRTRELKILVQIGELNREDLIWREGLEDFVKAKKIKGLFSAQSKPKPPPVPNSIPQQPIQEHKPPSPEIPQPVSADTGDSLTFKSTLAHGGKFAAILGGLGGFVGDILTPLGPLNGYLAIIAAVNCVVFIVLWRRLTLDQRSKWDRAIPNQALIFSVYSLIAFGFWFLAAQTSGETGVLGANIPAIAQMQATLLGIESNVQDIKEDTGEILAETKKISENVDGIGKLGGLIKNPTTASDFYHNARVNELGGDFRQAFADYERYMSFDQPFNDPVNSYLDLLKSQNGYQAAVHEFRNLKERFPTNKSVEFVSLRLFAGQERLDALQQFAKNNPEFGPVMLDLADFYSADQMPNRSGVDVEKEGSYLQKVLEANATGKFSRYFLDKKLADNLLANARGRLTANDDVGSTLRSGRKVNLFDVSGVVTVMDNTATKIFYSFDQNEWNAVPSVVKVETVGALSGGIPDWGKSDKPPESVYIKYIDHRGQESQVFDFQLDSDKWQDLKELGRPKSVEKYYDLINGRR